MSSTDIYTITEQQRFSFKPTYLYIKQHSITGLKYFGKTTKVDPIKYNGSGKYWKNHIKKHGKQIDTIWVHLFTDIDELVSVALALSEMYDIVDSPFWANSIPENGLDGYTSEQSKTISRRRFNDGTHHFLQDNFKNNISDRSKLTCDRMFIEGKLYYQTEEGRNRTSKREQSKSKNGEHNFQQPDIISIVVERMTNQNPSKLEHVRKQTSDRMTKLAEEGRLYSQSVEGRAECSKRAKYNQKELVSNGLHNFQKGLQKQKAQREIYQEVRELYKKLNMKIPINTYQKSDEYLQNIKTQLTELIG